MKQIKYWQLYLTVWLGITNLSCAQNKNSIELMDDEKLIEFTTDRFTLPNLHVTPDGKSIVFDVLGDIYKVPIEGGKAEVLLQDNNWKRAGKLSPSGEILAYISDETGEFQVWTIDLENKEKRVYPITESVHYPLNAYWKDKKNLLIPSKEGLWNFDVRTGEEYLLRAAKEEEKNIMHTTNSKMTINTTATHAYLTFDNILWAYDLVEHSEQFIGEFNELRKRTFVRISPDGQKALFFGTSTDSINKVALKYWNLETNDKRASYLTKDLGFTTTLDYSYDFIDDATIILDKEGEVVRMNIETGEYELIPIEVEVKKAIKKPLQRELQYIRDSIITASVLRNPVTRKDLDTIYFGAFGKLHSYAKETGVITEMYPKEDRFEVSPSLSPDGKYLAYTTWNDTEMGHVYARELKTGKEHQLTETAGRYINPAWSADGTEIVFVADETESKMGIPIQNLGPKSYKYHLDIHRINFHENGTLKKTVVSDTILRIFPFSQLPRRFYPIPIYHPNSKSIFITTRNHDKDLPTLIEIELETKEILQERLIPFHTDEVIVSPDAEHIAFVFDEQVWVDSFPHTLKLDFSEFSKYVPERLYYKGGIINNIILPEAKSVYELAPSYLYWQDKHTLMWGSAEEVCTYDIRTGETEKIADIKVQKSREIPKAQYALTNARIITMNKLDRIIENGTILVKDNRIEAVGEVAENLIPENYKVFDLEGKTIIPGLIDVHAHYHLNPLEFTNQQEFQYVGNLAYGVTSIYDPSVNILDYREQAQMVETGQLLGPRIFASGNIILETSGKHEYDYNKVLTDKDASRIVKSIVKLNASGPIKEYGFQNSLKRKRLKEASAASNIGITAHQTSFLEVLSRIVNGYTAIEHEIGSFPIQKDIVQLMSQSGIYYTPTYIVRPGINNIYVDKISVDREKLLYLNGGLLFHNYYAFTHEFQSEERQSIIDDWSKAGTKEHERATKTLKRIVESNGNLTVGGHGNPLPGIGTHWELWFMTKGMSNYKALQAATIKGAEKMDLQEELGSIETSKLADLLILNTNPLEDICSSTDILYTIQNGNIYEVETMKKIYPNEKALKSWGWDSDIVLKNMENIYVSGE